MRARRQTLGRSRIGVERRALGSQESPNPIAPTSGSLAQAVRTGVAPGAIGDGEGGGSLGAASVAVARDRLPELFVDGRQGSPRFARAQPAGVDLAALLAAYARAVGGGSRSKRRGGDPGPRKSLAA